MRTTFISQPFDAAGTPQTLGRLLTAEIGTALYTQLDVAVAYATSSGTSRIFGSVRDIVRAGGKAVFQIGLSNGVTSVQAAEHLLLAGASLSGFETASVLFHPKIYLLQGATQAWVSIGSSNLTADGLYRNFEANSVTVCDPNNPIELALVNGLLGNLANFRALQGLSKPILASNLPGLVTSGSLIDETQTSLSRRPSVGSGAVVRPRGQALRVQIPAAPPPHPELGTVRRPPAVKGVVPPVIAVPMQPRFFAMTLSDFDTSHRRGVPGTPEVSLPEDATTFFPGVLMQGRKYPDAYFEVLLNERAGTARRVSYRIWQRPAGAAVGHADWRINVGHDTIDQTQRGGDILLIEQLPPGSVPSYEVWIVQVGDLEHGPLLARCNRTVHTRGRAGVKQYGLF